MELEQAHPTTQFLTFQTGGDEYGIPISRVKEIVGHDVVTRVPGTPSWIKGVINLRGKVVPVVDLSIKFGFNESQVTKWTCFVIVEVDGLVLGVMADVVSNVMDLASDDIEPPPPFGTRIRMDFLLGMARDRNRFVLLLDADRVLSAEELLAAESISAPDPTVEGVGSGDTLSESKDDTSPKETIEEAGALQ